MKGWIILFLLKKFHANDTSISISSISFIFFLFFASVFHFFCIFGTEKEIFRPLVNRKNNYYFPKIWRGNRLEIFFGMKKNFGLEKFFFWLGKKFGLWSNGGWWKKYQKNTEKTQKSGVFFFQNNEKQKFQWDFLFFNRKKMPAGSQKEKKRPPGPFGNEKKSKKEIEKNSKMGREGPNFSLFLYTRNPSPLSSPPPRLGVEG